MYAGYYKKFVKYGDIECTILVRLDEDKKAYMYSEKEKKWIESKDHAFVWENLEYDKISKEEAERIIKR